MRPPIRPPGSFRFAKPTSSAIATDARAHDFSWCAACEKHERDPGTLQRHVTVGVNLTNTAYPIPGASPFTGSTAQSADRVAEYAALDVQHVSIMPHPWTRAGIERFATVIETLRM